MQQITSDFWRGKRVLLTGHTGFKGSWLSLWLQSLGVSLRGIALEPPTDPALFDVAQVVADMEHRIVDIRDFAAVKAQLDEFQPEILIHMAAQPLVRLSYSQPIETYATNVMGTVHVLEAARHAGSIKAIVNITTDKCYENREWVWGYREDEPMGGFDPYSNSKGCAELVSSAYRKSFLKDTGIAMATARAGNVIGGGDWAMDRLVPDILRALQDKQPVQIRNPHAIRPWQHVLEPLSGCVDDVGFHHQVLVDEFGRVGVVGMNATHLGCSQVDLIGLFCGEKFAHCRLVGQVQLGVGAGDDVGMPLRLQSAYDGRTDHATVACDVNFG